MNEVKLNQLFAAVLSLGQLVVGFALLMWGPNEIAKGIGIGLLTGGAATGTTARMRTRGTSPKVTTLMVLVLGLAVASSACGALGGLVKKVSPAERDRAIALLVANDFEVQETALSSGCEDGRAEITAYRGERDALLRGVETVYSGKCSSRATGILDAIATAAKIAATITLGGPAGELAHVIVAAIADGITSDDCDAFARLHMEIGLSDEQADAGLEDLCTAEGEGEGSLRDVRGAGRRVAVAVDRGGERTPLGAGLDQHGAHRRVLGLEQLAERNRGLLVLSAVRDLLCELGERERDLPEPQGEVLVLEELEYVRDCRVHRVSFPPRTVRGLVRGPTWHRGHQRGFRFSLFA